MTYNLLFLFPKESSMKCFISCLARLLFRRKKVDLYNEMDFLGYEAYSQQTAVAAKTLLAKVTAKVHSKKSHKVVPFS
jgi:hypothetical protein